MIIEIALGIALGGMLLMAGSLYICTNTDFIMWYFKKIIKTMADIQEKLEDEELNF